MNPSAEQVELLAGLGAPAGLCAGCNFALLNRTRRGTTYLRCGLAAQDARFPRYPPLPVLGCAGYRPRADGGQGPTRLSGGP